MKKLMIVLLSLVFVGAFTLPAFAADWDFYGSSRMATFYTDQDEEAGDDDGLTWGLQGNSRIGARVQGDVVGGGFEYGSVPNLRKLYGTAQLGGGTLLVGQTYTPFNMFYSSQVFGTDADLLNTGGVFNGRQPMLQYSCAGLKVALVRNQGTELGEDYTMPRLEVKYSRSAGMLGYALAGEYQTYEVNDQDVDSYGLTLGLSANFGAFGLKGDAFLGQNLSETGQWIATTSGPVLSPAGVDDEDTSGGIMVATYDLDQVALEAGYGYVQSEQDVSASDANDQSCVYGQATITIADGFFVVPEVGYYDYMENASGVDEGSMTYAGLKWQINF